MILETVRSWGPIFHVEFEVLVLRLQFDFEFRVVFVELFDEISWPWISLDVTKETDLLGRPCISSSISSAT